MESSSNLERLLAQDLYSKIFNELVKKCPTKSKSNSFLLQNGLEVSEEFLNSDDCVMKFKNRAIYRGKAEILRLNPD